MKNPLFEPIEASGIGKSFRDISFVDIDSDGDEDFFACDTYGLFHYFENSGKQGNASFIYRSGTSNPLYGVHVSIHCNGEFEDMDGDGDFDVLATSAYETVFYENTGSATNPTFPRRVGKGRDPPGLLPNYRVHGAKLSFMHKRNPTERCLVIGKAISRSQGLGFYRKVFVSNRTRSVPGRYGDQIRHQPFFDFPRALRSTRTTTTLKPVFADFNDDGRVDVLLATRWSLHILENNGTKTKASFIQKPFPGELPQTGPFPLVNYIKPAVADITNDGLLDIMIGTYDGTFLFFRNTGTKTVPKFTRQTQTQNPMHGKRGIGTTCQPKIETITNMRIQLSLT